MLNQDAHQTQSPELVMKKSQETEKGVSLLVTLPFLFGQILTGRIRSLSDVGGNALFRNVLLPAGDLLSPGGGEEGSHPQSVRRSLRDAHVGGVHIL